MALDPYFTLGVAADATLEQIEKAWRSKRGVMHPDKNPGDPYATTKFQLLKESYEMLRDDARRAAYDTGADPRMARLDEHATAALAEAMARIAMYATRIDIPHVIKHLRVDLEALLVQLVEAMPVMDQSERRLLQLAKRCRRIGRGKNVLRQSVEAQIASLAMARENMLLQIEAVKAALAMLNQYVDGAPTETLMLASWSFATTDSGFFRGKPTS